MTTESDDILQIYRIAVRNAITSGNTDVVPNSSPQHACIIIEEMLDAAKESFIAFSGAFHDDVWTPAVINALRRAKRRDVQIALIASDDASCVPEEVKDSAFVIRKDEASTAELSRLQSPRHHFAVADGRIVRVEYDLEKRMAAFSANRTDVANALIDEFLKLRKISDKAAA